MKRSQIHRLRAQAIAWSLFSPTTLKRAVQRMGFIQADPIRAPARAQDLILRHRVKGYRAGDLERRYASLDIEEDFLYAYGFVTQPVWRLLHPRSHLKRLPLSKLSQRVLEIACAAKEIHPRELEAHLGKARVINAWGGYSKATTRALEELHRRGLVRICRREQGIRVYQAINGNGQIELSPEARLRGLILLIAEILSPVPRQTLQSNIMRYQRLGNPRAALKQLIAQGALEQETIDGVTYCWPAGKDAPRDPPEQVRFLAPFDPLVWDRRRFEHLWGWAYRFEAYTPPARRIRGYYAMPLLWQDDVIGWATAQMRNARLEIVPGFVQKRPTTAAFKHALEEEAMRLTRFLGLKTSCIS